MRITTEDSRTLAEMLGNTLQPGWHVRLKVVDPLTYRLSAIADVTFDEVRGNNIFVRTVDDKELLAFDLQHVQAIHIY